MSIKLKELPQWVPTFDPGYERCRGCSAERRKRDWLDNEGEVVFYEEVHDPSCPY